MEVYLLAATKHPMETISIAAGTCYGKPDISQSRVKHCFEGGHMSVFEHASATFEVEGISRSCSHQLVRHRLASYSQQSQRYCRIDVAKDDWYVVPPDILKDDAKLRLYRRMMAEYATNYILFLEEQCKPEDARYLLPEACKTDIVVSMNLRELYHFLDLRQSKRSQWEIRNLAYLMERVLSKEDDEWKFLLELRQGGDAEW